MATKLSVNDLLAGSSQKHTVTIPAHVLPEDAQAAGGEVLLRPLTVGDVQRIGKAAKDQGVLTSVLMVQQALVEPPMSVEQVSRLSAGLAQFLLGEVNRISGLSLSEENLQQAIKAPLTRAIFILAREFGWTPAECAELTVGQVLLYLEMLAGDSRDATREDTA
ncbi:hypothetical protein SAMN05660964_01433 [Thiothrix caldifontis]|uniref:Uncharacterized protein n=1 Tax=Thiothrix caldifontis TaxID=525918 RepID=A0A1H4ANH8_9GAMM|nr:hypothetical protein [Thiothrix caldifontis]SEA37381.1 hypothetical protein SAMN05660964_01433 [Thiothrix caldifontis]